MVGTWLAVAESPTVGEFLLILLVLRQKVKDIGLGWLAVDIGSIEE